MFFFNDTAPTEIYTLSLHDALPIYHRDRRRGVEGVERRPQDRVVERPVADRAGDQERVARAQHRAGLLDRKSTRLNSSHANISYAVFCLKKKHNSNDDPLVCVTDRT